MLLGLTVVLSLLFSPAKYTPEEFNFDRATIRELDENRKWPVSVTIDGIMIGTILKEEKLTPKLIKQTVIRFNNTTFVRLIVKELK